MSTASAAAPATVQRTHSSRRSHAYHSSTPGQPHRTHSTSSRAPPVVLNSQRPASQYSHARPPSSGQQQFLGNVLPQRDYETSNVAEASSSRRSMSRDRAYAPAMVSRTESTRSTHRTSSRPGHGRYGSDATTASTIVANGESTPVQTPAAAADHAELNPSGTAQPARRRTTITGKSGQWTLGKTIGAGSMGKVKLAKKLETGEQVGALRYPCYAIC